MIALTVVLALWAFASFGFTMGAITATRSLWRRSRGLLAHPPTHWPSLALLRPCEGLDADLEENLLSAATAAYAGERALYLLIPSRRDPAWPVAERVVARAALAKPSVKVHLIETAIQTQANRKVAQLACAPVAAEVVVVADSDVRLDDRTLPSLIGVLCADPRAGAASAPYLEVMHETWGDRLSSALLSSTPHAFFCLSALAERSRGAHVVSGALMAIRRPVLEEVGGWASLEPYLGEDFELARRLHARGYTIPTSPEPAQVMDRQRAVGQVLRRFMRWSTVTRQQRPHLFPTYLLLLGSSPLLLIAGLGALLAPLPHGVIAVGMVGLALVARLVFSTLLRRVYRRSLNPLRVLAALLAGESLIVVTSLSALGRPHIEWRGHRYHVGPGGLLERLE